MCAILQTVEESFAFIGRAKAAKSPPDGWTFCCERITKSSETTLFNKFKFFDLIISQSYEFHNKIENSLILAECEEGFVYIFAKAEN